MAISAILGQAVDFSANYYRNRCGDRDTQCFAEQTDVMAVQVMLSEFTGTQLLSDSDFTTGAPWTFGGDWTYDAVNDEADNTGGGAGALSHTEVLASGKYYKCVVTVTAYSGGTLSVEGVKIVDSLSGLNEGVGTYTVYFVGDGNAFALDGNSLFISLSSVQLYEMSSPGIRVLEDCTGTTVAYSDYTNTDGHIEYMTADGGGQPMAQIQWNWEQLALADGCYRICLVDAGGQPETPSALPCQQTTCCYELADEVSETLLLTWTNDNNMVVGNQGLFNYTYFTFIQYLRVKGRLTDPTWPIDTNRYNFSDGGMRTVSAFVKEHVELKVSGRPPQMRAISFGVVHDAFYVDAIRHFVESSGVNPEWRRLRNAANVEIELVRHFSQISNSYCDPQPVNCTDEWNVHVIFDSGTDTATFAWHHTGEFDTEQTDGASSFTYDGSNFAAWSKQVTAGTTITIVRSSNVADEILTLIGTVT